MSGVYYNDSEPFVCDWLENLIREKLLPAGVVDRRPIQEVEPKDVQGFTQCHFFAGIGGWAYALQLAGWGDRPVWTGSCPCQPFSAAGKRQAHDDPRHLWPAWFRLIRECRPERIFGEQVAGAAGLGWLDVVSTDLEAEAYTVGAAVLGAHSVGAPHIRQRLYFVGESATGRRGSGRSGEALRGEIARGAAERPSAPVVVADSESGGWTRQQLRGNGESPQRTPEVGPSSSMAEPEGEQARTTRFTRQFWNADFIPCRDGKARPVEPGTFPLAHGIPGRVGRLRAYGNSIVPQVAAAFVRAYMDCGASDYSPVTP